MLVLLGNLSCLWLFFTFYQEKEKKRCIFQSTCGPRRVLERYVQGHERSKSIEDIECVFGIAVVVVVVVLKKLVYKKYF